MSGLRILKKMRRPRQDVLTREIIQRQRTGGAAIHCRAARVNLQPSGTPPNTQHGLGVIRGPEVPEGRNITAMPPGSGHYLPLQRGNQRTNALAEKKKGNAVPQKSFLDRSW